MQSSSATTILLEWFVHLLWGKLHFGVIFLAPPLIQPIQFSWDSLSGCCINPSLASSEHFWEISLGRGTDWKTRSKTQSSRQKEWGEGPVVYIPFLLFYKLHVIVLIVICDTHLFIECIVAGIVLTSSSHISSHLTSTMLLPSFVEEEIAGLPKVMSILSGQMAELRLELQWDSEPDFKTLMVKTPLLTVLCWLRYAQPT